MNHTVGSLFSGIGGIDLGLERAGFEVRWQCEADAYCRKVLAKHWPNVHCYDDVRTLPDDIEPVDLVCGGYPCQPFSLAGTRHGEDDPRHLWPYFASTIRLLRPRHALLENVPGHLSLGFGAVLGDLAEMGYDAEWTCIPAAAVGAPHLRWRLFVVAHTDCDFVRDESESVFGRSGTALARVNGAEGNVANAPSDPWRSRSDQAGQIPEITSDRTAGLDITELADGSWWDVEPKVGRVAHGVPARVDRLRALGNAVVPQVAEAVGRMLMAHLARSA